MADTYNVATYGGANADTTRGGIGAVVADIAALIALQAAMVVVGTGNNSANVTTMGTDLTTLAADVAAIGGANSPIVLLVDLSRFSSRSALVNIIKQLAVQVAAPIAGA
jgi:hypothetical protein